MYTSSKISKKTPLKYQFLCFLITLDPLWSKFWPKDLNYFTFLTDFQKNMLGNTININNLCCNPAALKKGLKNLLKIVFLYPICTEKGSIWATSKVKKHFLAEITKADHQLSESFYLIKISYALTELWILFYLEWCFLLKKYHFQQKQLWTIYMKHVYTS